MSAHTEFLRSIDFLREAPESVLDRIAGDVTQLERAADEEVFADGTVGDAMYFIVKGRIRIEKNGFALLRRGPSEYIGEMALIDEGPRSAAAVADTDAVLLRWEKRSFQDSLVENGQIALMISRALTSKIRQEVETVTGFRQDVDRAAQVQSAMLPEERYSSPVVDLAAHCLQAEHVGGDFFDYLPLGDDRFGVIIADTQGHGFQAALLVAMLKTSLHGQLARDPSPGKVMRTLNRAILRYVKETLLATCCYLVIDSESQRFKFSSAGHNPQFHYQAATGRISRIDSTGIPLGVLGQAATEWRVEQRDWEPRDLIVLCTDGVREAKNDQGEEFGDDRIEEVIRELHDGSPQDLEQALRRRLRDFCGDPVSFEDDVTVLVARLGPV